MAGVDWVNDPRVVAAEPNFVSVNASTEVDLTGQCASETVAGRYWSSSGGQADFARGAICSESSKAFIVLRSTTEDVLRSRIRVTLTEGVGRDHAEEHRRPRGHRARRRRAARPVPA